MHSVYSQKNRFPRYNNRPIEMKGFFLFIGHALSTCSNKEKRISTNDGVKCTTVWDSTGNFNSTFNSTCWLSYSTVQVMVGVYHKVLMGNSRTEDQLFSLGITLYSGYLTPVALLFTHLQLHRPKEFKSYCHARWTMRTLRREIVNAREVRDANHYKSYAILMRVCKMCVYTK